MRIFIVSRGYPTPNDPQWGCFEKDQALALQKLGHEVVMLSIDRRIKFSNIGKSHRYDQFHIYNYRTFLPGKLLREFSVNKYVSYFSDVMYELFNLAVQKHGLPDIIYAHYLLNIALTKKIKKIHKIPIIGMEHWSAINKEPLSNTVYECGKIAYNNINVLLSVSLSLQSRIKQIWNKDSIVLHNMVGGEFEVPKIKIKSTSFQFVSIGRLISLKGFEVLIKAFLKSDLKKHNVKLLIIGDGKERTRLQNLILNNNLSDNIQLLGVKTKKEIVNYLSQSDAFVLPSRSETFGVVFIEAMMQGLPVIGTRCGGPEEFINKDNGILVNVDDVDGLSEALIEMYENISNYDRENIAINCRNNFSSNVISNKLITIFNNEIVTNK